MFYYITSTFKLFSIITKYFVLDKNNKEDCQNFLNNFLTLGTVPVKMCQWVINYTYHLPSKNRKTLLFKMCYEQIMNKCQTHDIYYTQDILKKYDIKVKNLKLINSGSIGQVYSGEWNGKIVALKVLHPDVNSTTNYWFYVLKIIFFILKVSNNLKKLNLDWESLKIYFRSQFDFREEGKNLEKFHEYYKNNDYVIIPYPYFYKKDLLIMDYIDSQSFDILEKSYSKYNIFKIYTFMLLMIEDMFFNLPYLHGDLHNGNYGIILRDNNSFQVVLYDFGLIIPNSVDICLIYNAMNFKEVDKYIESLLNVYNIDKNFISIIKPVAQKEIEKENVNFNEILDLVVQNDGELKITIESIFLLTAFFNNQRFKNVSSRDAIIDKISVLEDLNCLPDYCDKLISFCFEQDTSFLDRKKIFESIYSKLR